MTVRLSERVSELAYKVLEPGRLSDLLLELVRLSELGGRFSKVVCKRRCTLTYDVRLASWGNGLDVVVLGTTSIRCAGLVTSVSCLMLGRISGAISGIDFVESRIGSDLEIGRYTFLHQGEAADRKPPLPSVEDNNISTKTCSSINESPPPLT
ncbi:hypothetical protein MTR_7g028715 [Medicago truncatula]|uniref:Uncharacterized protein n=1 Tax=Medicago truncatula TaxID=3880 RepID=A0A072TXS9_MEDTR|nr:hypothetical protein MTR_7g028715 [Medicago truncatula]